MAISLSFRQYLSGEWVELGAMVFSGDDASVLADDFEIEMMNQLNSRGRVVLLTADNSRVCIDISCGPVRTRKSAP